MKELRDVITAWRETRGKCAALATVVAVEGSSYRKPGARMLITVDGPLAGSVSGGCLEADVLEHGVRVIATGEPILLTYDSRDDGDDLAGVGTGCRGVVRILVERLNPDGEALALPEPLLDLRESAVLALVYRADDPAMVGRRLLLRGDESPCGSLLADKDPNGLAGISRSVLSAGKSRNVTVHAESGSASIFFEVIRPPQALLVYGAGADAVPLVRIAAEIGWRVTVADHRPAYAVNARFPQAESVVIARPEELLGCVSVDSETAVVIMTHNYTLDCALLDTILTSGAFYVGLLGSQTRAERIRWMNGTHSRYLHAPVGLSIGAETPEEIAIAVVAEIVAEANRARTQEPAPRPQRSQGREHSPCQMSA